MEKKQRILLVHNYYRLQGGEDTAVSNEKKLLEDHGHQVYLYTRSNLEMDRYSALRKLWTALESVFSIRTYKEVKKLIREKQIDVVHVHNTLTLVTPSVYYAAFSCHVPVIQTLHNFRLLCPGATFLRNGTICEECVEKGLGCAVRNACYRDSRLQTLMSAAILQTHRWLGTYARLFYICLTEFNRKKFLQGKSGIREDHIFLKPNFVPEPPEAETEKKDYYIYIGRLERLKGIHILLEAWRKLPQKLMICGSGPEREWCENYLKTYQMEQVTLMGQVAHEETLRLLAGAKALVFPTQCYEGQSISMTESYAAGTPVIASDLGNSRDMIEEGKTGLCFAYQDAEELKKAVSRFEETTGWETREVFREKYSPEKNYQILLGIYRTVQNVQI